MGAYNGAEVCELIGIFMLSLLSKHTNKNHIGLHRDDGLPILKNTSGPEAEKLKKKFQKLFKEKYLDLIIQCNLKITNYLDITLNLNDGSYCSYRKPNEETNYIHINLDHPPSIIKEIPRSFEKRLSILVSSAIYYEKCQAKISTTKKKTIKTKTIENITLFGSIQHAASSLKPGKYSSI